jgi:peroxiredoxin
MKTILTPGVAAPDFVLPATPDQTVSLQELRGQPVILAFYPADWSPVCGDELTVFNEALPLFRKRHAQMVGISVDGVWCHDAFAKARRLRFLLLADFEPKAQVARSFGVYDELAGTAKRAGPSIAMPPDRPRWYPAGVPRVVKESARPAPTLEQESWTRPPAWRTRLDLHPDARGSPGPYRLSAGWARGFPQPGP